MPSRRAAYLYRNPGTGLAEVARAGIVRLPTFNGATVADLTRDGIPDLVYADNAGFAYRAGTATGLSSTTVRIGAVRSGATGWSTLVGDINGDGRPDVDGLVASAGGTGNPDDDVYVTSATGDVSDVAAVPVSDRTQFVVPNGGNDESEASGPVQLIAWR